MNVRQQARITRQTRSTQRGLSLLELLIAMALGLFLTWGAIQAFLTGKQTYSMQQGLSRLQENSRIAQEFIGFDVRGAGSVGGSSGSFIGGRPRDPGCGSTCGTSGTAPCTGVNMLNNSGNAEYNFSRPVMGADNVPATGNPTALLLWKPLNPIPIAGTDILVVHTSTDLGLTVLNFNSSVKTASQLSATTYNQGLAVGDIVALADYTRSKIFQVNGLNVAGANATITWSAGGATTGTPGNACDTWTEGYRFGWGINATTGMDYFSPEVTLKRLDTAIYYVATNPAGRPALYRRMLQQVNSEELLDGVENLQLEFGVDVNNNFIIDSWQTANNVTGAQWSNWDDLTDLTNTKLVSDLMSVAQQNVIAVRYSLLLRTDEELLEAPQNYTYNGVAVVAPDRRLRQVVTGTIGIRSGLN
jgi:type IV pilus assembly protein PilW